MFYIPPLSKAQKATIQDKINQKTKPLGALGDLEEIALQVALIQQTPSPELSNPHLLVFAGDHGIAGSGVSAYPQAVTQQMVLNFLSGGAAINVFCRQHDINLKIIDAGVNADFENTEGLINHKIRKGTSNFLEGRAMSEEEALEALEKGAALVREVHETGCNVIGFGEMGIGNTSAASLLMHTLTGIPLEGCVGKGTGLDEAQLTNKLKLLQTAKAFHRLKKPTILQTLATFGGFEIAMMCGAMLQSAAKEMLVLVDGFIATSACLVASQIEPQVLDYCLFSHQSDEAGHKKLLQFLKKKPILQLNMRLGEGTGCALAYPLVQSAVNFLNEMSSFEDAGVSQKN